MSYDLFFKPKGDASPDKQKFIEYFQGRPNYEVSDTQAVYSNEETGVYFVFDFEEAKGEDADSHDSALAFNLNYFRPHVFALEAENEVEALVRKFSLLVEDPQVDGTGEGEFSAKQFISGWAKGNESACQSFLREPDPARIFTLPTSQIETAWRWNGLRQALQDRLGLRIFVPKISFMKRDGGVGTFVVWSDAVSMALPDVDYLVLYRRELAPRRLFSKQEGLAVRPMDECREILKAFPTKTYGLPYKLVAYAKPPKEIVRLFKSGKSIEGELDIVPPDNVLNEETVRKYRRPTSS
jgi:hypothetical protein